MLAERFGLTQLAFEVSLRRFAETLMPHLPDDPS